jgi:hypothetical protein
MMTMMRVGSRDRGSGRDSGPETMDAKASSSCARGEQAEIELVKTRLTCALGRFAERDRIVRFVLYSPFRKAEVRKGEGELSFASAELAGECRLLCSMIEEETLVWTVHRSWRGESRLSRGEAGRRRVHIRD